MINYERIVLTIKQNRKTMKKKKRKKAESFLEIQTVPTYPTINPSIESVDMNTRPLLLVINRLVISDC